MIETNLLPMFVVETCARLYTRGRRLDGFYNIRKPDIAASLSNQIYLRAWCDLHGPNGGWILLSQRSDMMFNSYRNWVSYEKGFGIPAVNFWLGNSFIHGITFNRRNLLRIEFTDFVDEQNQNVFAEYDNFQLSGPFTGYVLRIGRHRGSLFDFLSVSNNSAFSTWDRDNDKVDGECAKIMQGAWWYGDTCGLLDLNSMKGFNRFKIKAKEISGGKFLKYTYVSRTHSRQKR